MYLDHTSGLRLAEQNHFSFLAEVANWLSESEVMKWCHPLCQSVAAVCLSSPAVPSDACVKAGRGLIHAVTVYDGRTYVTIVVTTPTYVQWALAARVRTSLCVRTLLALLSHDVALFSCYNNNWRLRRWCCRGYDARFVEERSQSAQTICSVLLSLYCRSDQSLNHIGRLHFST